MRANANVTRIESPDVDNEVTTTSQMPAPDGQRIGHYLIFEEIARGEMGSLHLGCALDPSSFRPVAIKHLYPWLAANSGYVDTYVREARMTARIRHPNVALTTDVVTGRAGDDVYLVMEYVHGDTLAHLLSEARRLEGAGPPPAIVAGIMVGLLRGLHAVQEATRADDLPASHAQREVSPQDVIVGLDGVTRIFEFGAVSLARGHIRELVSDPGADVFSAATLLWEILAGRRLYGDSEEWDIFPASAARLTPAPSHFNHEVPPELDAVVLRALRRDRDRRYQSAEEFADAIERALTPAEPSEIGDWVARTSTRLLAARAVRVAGIMRGVREAVAARPAAAQPTAIHREEPWTLPGPDPWRRAVVVVAVTVAAALLGAGLWARAGEPAHAAATAERPLVHTTKVAGQAAPPAGAPAATVVAAVAPPADDAAAGASALAPAVQRVANRAAADRAARPSIKRIARLNRAALSAYGRLDPSTARRRLHAALAECARAGLARHAVAARTHALLGVVLAGGYRQPEMGAEQFRSALRIDPRVPLPPRYASEADVAAAFRAAVAARDLRSQ